MCTSNNLVLTEHYVIREPGVFKWSKCLQIGEDLQKLETGHPPAGERVQNKGRPTAQLGLVFFGLFSKRLLHCYSFSTVIGELYACYVTSALRESDKSRWSDKCDLSDTCFVRFMNSRKATMFTKIAFFFANK
jgi:hypothetical protein